MAVDFTLWFGGWPVILSAIAERLKRRSKDDFRGRHFEAPLILQTRGSLAVWFFEAAVQAWKAEPRTTRGGHRTRGATSGRVPINKVSQGVAASITFAVS